MPRPELDTLTSLNPLRGHVSAIHTAAFFHLFTEDDQLYLARAIGGLLSPQPGSIIFGSHTGAAQKGNRISLVDGCTLFDHCPESWEELWNGMVFKKGTVKVDVTLLPSWVDPSRRALTWTVTRL